MKKLFITAILFSLACFAALFVYLHEVDSKKKSLTLYGNVDVRQVDLGFRVEGRVSVMPFQEGDLVAEGMLIAALDKQPYEDQVRIALANLGAQKLTLANAEKIFQRRKELVKDGSVSEEDYQDSLTSFEIAKTSLEQAEANLGVALTNLKETESYAPATGTVLTRIREPGSVVKPSDPVCTLSLLDPVWIRTFISEPELGLIYPGMPAEIYTDSEPENPYKGHIGFISPVAEFTPKTVETTQLRTDLVYRLRIIAENPASNSSPLGLTKGLRQGMPVTVKLPLKEGSK